MIDLRPTVCNLCGGHVRCTSNSEIYGREYGSGKCYLCEQCGAYVGTHRPRPREALGLLADARMRRGKMCCHGLFDAMWRGKPKAHKKRKDLYKWLAGEMDIPTEECHFGYFDLEQLEKAYRILREAARKTMRYTNCGEIYFSESENGMRCEE